jgi:hypothetical protein
VLACLVHSEERVWLDSFVAHAFCVLSFPPLLADSCAPFSALILVVLLGCHVDVFVSST